MDQIKDTTTSIHVEEALESADKARAASSELTEISGESLQWVSGGPNGSIAVMN